jgi:hypothetical protein
MVTTGAAIGNSFPVVPLEGWNRVCGCPANGTGMSAFHVNLPADQPNAGRQACAPLAMVREKIQPRSRSHEVFCRRTGTKGA